MEHREGNSAVLDSYAGTKSCLKWIRVLSGATVSARAATSCHYRKSNISILKWKTEITICFYWGCNHPFCSPYDSLLKANEENLFYSSGFDQSVLRKIIIQQTPLFNMKYIRVINVSSGNCTKKDDKILSVLTKMVILWNRCLFQLKVRFCRIFNIYKINNVIMCWWNALCHLKINT